MRVTPSGAKSFMVYRWINGRPVKLTLGRVGTLRLADARRSAERAVAAIADGRDPLAERQAARVQGITLTELFERWKARRWSSLRPRTQESFASLWTVHIEPALGKAAVKDLSRAKIQEFIDRLVSGDKRATARKVKALVHLLMAEAVRRDVIVANPAAEVDAPAYVARSRIVSSQELGPLMQAIDEAGEPWADFFRLKALIGARLSSMYSMAWADIDLARGTWSIPGLRNKSGKLVVLPLVPEAVEILRKRLARRAGEPWVFPGRGDEGHVTGCARAWTAVLERAGIEGLVRHDLRRTLATRMAAAGVGDRVLAAALGHTSLSAVKHYIHLAGEVARSAMSDAAAALPPRK